jgi:hypothetical protein
MEQIIKCLLLKNDTVLISEIVEIGSELGEPDCKLTKPFKLVEQSNSFTNSFTLEPWITFTLQNEIMLHSDSILTIVDPIPELLSKYFEMIA